MEALEAEKLALIEPPGDLFVTKQRFPRTKGDISGTKQKQTKNLRCGNRKGLLSAQLACT